MANRSDIDGFIERTKAITPGVSGHVAQNMPATITEQIAERLAAMIERGEFKPGDRLLEVELAARFNVSRGPVRESLHILDKEGLVKLNPRRGVFVRQPTADEIRHIYEVRAALFELACRKASRIGTSSLTELARSGISLLEKTLKRGDQGLDDFLRIRAGLGTIVLALAENPTLAKTLDQLSRLSIIHRQGMANAERRATAAKLWTALIDAVEAENEAEAATAARRLVENARDELLVRVET